MLAPLYHVRDSMCCINYLLCFSLAKSEETRVLGAFLFQRQKTQLMSFVTVHGWNIWEAYAEDFLHKDLVLAEWAIAVLFTRADSNWAVDCVLGVHVSVAGHQKLVLAHSLDFTDVFCKDDKSFVSASKFTFFE